MTVRFPPRPKPDYYKGDYPRRAKAVTDAAKADPFAVCWRCGKTLSQHPRHKTGRPPHWQAGHLIAGSKSGPLMPEASTCNGRDGARLGQLRSQRNRRRGDLTW